MDIAYKHKRLLHGKYPEDYFKDPEYELAAKRVYLAG